MTGAEKSVADPVSLPSSTRCQLSVEGEVEEADFEMAMIWTSSCG